MPKSNRTRTGKARRSGVTTGMPPGTMVHIGAHRQAQARIEVFDFNVTTFNEVPTSTVDQCLDLARGTGVTWINVNGIHDLDLIESLGKAFELHPLTLEDIVNTTQRLKVEEFTDYLFIVMKMMVFDETENTVRIEHVSLILGPHYVISFIEDEGDVFDSVRARIRTSKGRIRTMKADYLAFVLMDTVIDHYFLAVEQIGDRIEDIDDQILSEPKPGHIEEIHRLKREILHLRKAAWPLREEISALEKSESPLINPETRLYWRDLYDHTIQIIDMIENYRDILGSMHDTYLSSISNRMNEVMKVLTIIATLFIPLTFIVGIYGMNFEYMPELKWHHGYYMVWAVMLAVSIGLLLFFRWKKWL